MIMIRIMIMTMVMIRIMIMTMIMIMTNELNWLDIITMIRSPCHIDLIITVKKGFT